MAGHVVTDFVGRHRVGFFVIVQKIRPAYVYARKAAVLLMNFANDAAGKPPVGFSDRNQSIAGVNDSRIVWQGVTVVSERAIVAGGQHGRRFALEKIGREKPR